MSRQFEPILGVLKKVRRRWLWHTIFRCATAAAVSCALVLALAALVFRALDPRSAAAAGALEAVTLAALVLAAVRSLRPLTRRPKDVQVARFIEEHCPQLEDSLVTAVECASKSAAAPGGLTELLYRDAANRVAGIDLDRTISRRTLRRSAVVAGIATLVAAAAVFIAAPGLIDGARTVVASIHPGYVALRVRPGSISIAAGTPVHITVDVRGTPAARPTLVVRTPAGTSRNEMSPTNRAGLFEYALRPTADLRYSVRSGPVASREYSIKVLHPASVTSIDVHYQFPPELGLPPRTEQGGDVYAPAGTRVRLRIHTDRPVRAGSLLVAGNPPAPLSVESDRLVDGAFDVVADGTYRVALADVNGLENPGDVEYFIRVVTDAPPDVRIVEPAADRDVTALEEVTVAAHAEDDRGIKDFDLVYSVRGGPEVAVPFPGRGTGRVLDGRRILYLEDLHVRPGDFISYYARARDEQRHGGGAEARSDIFFLQVTPFEQEFMAPQSSEAASGGVGLAARSLDDLVRAQKQIIVATWRLDRRARRSRASGSEADVKAVARAQGDLRTRALAMAGAEVAPAAGRTERRAGEAEAAAGGGNPMANAVEAMGRAEQALDAVSTSDALPHENRALNELLKAQAEQQRWQLQRARGGAGADNGASNADLTTLFDRELQRQQRTNYEMPRGSGQRDEQAPGDALARLRELARRQDELNRQQQELARDRSKMSDDEVKRQLERLTREQADLRQQAEQLAQQMKAGQASGQAGAGSGRQPGTRSPSEAGAVGEASRAMGQAAAALRDGKPDQASASGSQATDRLRAAEEQMRGRPGRGTPTLGDLQMEARQLADGQAQIARESASAGTGKAAADTMRRLAGEKERLADQVEHLAQGVKDAAAGAGLDGRQRQQVGGVSRDLDRLQLPARMRRDAAAMRDPAKADVNQPPSAEGEQDLAKTLSRLSDRIGAAAGSRATQQASEQLEQTRDARDRLARLEKQIAELRRQTSEGATGSAAGGASSTDSSTTGKPVGTSGRGAGDRAAALERLQDEYARELRRAADQLDRLQTDGGGAGITPEGARTLSPISAPGFHQDYSKWEQLSREISAGLDRAETVLTKKLRDEQARDRLQAPAASRAPEEYRRLVEQYYAALAKR